MFIHKGPIAIIKPHPFPHTITEHEAGVIYAYRCLRARGQGAVDPDQNGLIAWIVFGGVGGDFIGHAGTLRRSADCSKR